MWDVNRNQSLIEVFWTTKIICEAFRRFRYIIYIDAMKCHINYLHWPYPEPVILDQEWQIMPIFDMLSLSGLFGSYDFALNFMFYFKPHMQMKVRFIFPDCGNNE